MKTIPTKTEAINQLIINNQPEYLKVYGFATDWIKTRMREFTAEDLKAAYEKLNGVIRQPCIYGAVFTVLANNGLIKYKRHEKAKCPAARSRQISVWISIHFRLRQQNNRRNDHGTINLFQ